MADNGQKKGEQNGDDRWGAGVIPNAKMGYWEPDYEPKDTDDLVRITPDEEDDAS